MPYSNPYKKQSGLAGIMFVLFFPALFGVYVWATDGARMLQSDARLTDAMEVAVLAVAAEGSDKDDDRVKTAKKFVNAYFSDVSIDKITVTSNSKEAEDDGYAYKLNVKVERDTIFPKSKSLDIGYDDTFTMNRSSAAKKGLTEGVDVILVADYSGSMRDKISSSATQEKYKDLVEVVKQVGATLEEYNKLIPEQAKKSKMAIVPFNYLTSNDNGIFHHLVCDELIDREIDNIRGSYDYKETTTYANCYYVVRRYKKSDYTGNYKTDSDWNGWRYTNSYYVNAKKSVEGLLNEKNGKVRDGSLGYFEDISLTDDFKSINTTIKDFKPTSSTASYSGLIRAAQVAKKGSNPRRLIILLSDGMDSYGGVSNALLNADLCGEIVSSLTETKNNVEIKAEIAAIGLGKTDNYDRMERCVGADRVFDGLGSMEEVKKQILTLIAEEVGSLVR